MAMNMTIKGISDNVDALLDGSGKFVDVEAAPQDGDTLQFDGYPSAFHYYENTDPSVATVTQHRRAIQYIVQIVGVYPDSLSNADKFAKIYSLLDSTIQLFDVSRDLHTSTLPRACDILRPVPGELSRVMTNEGEGLMATIRLTCEADVSHTNY